MLGAEFTSLILFRSAALAGSSSFNSVFSPFPIFSTSFAGMGCRAGERTIGATFVELGVEDTRGAAIVKATVLAIDSNDDNEGLAV